MTERRADAPERQIDPTRQGGETEGRLSPEREAAEMAHSRVDAAFTLYASHKQGIAQLIESLRWAADALSADVFDQTGRPDHDARVRGLLEANNREVERRREAEAERDEALKNEGGDGR